MIQLGITSLKRSFSACLFLCLVLSSCSPAQRLARSYGVNKTTLAEDIREQSHNGELSFRYDHNKYMVLQQEVTALDDHPDEYMKARELAEGEFEGPFLQNETSLYYLKKVKSEQQPYGHFYLAQVEQPFGMSDDLFQAHLDSIKTECLHKKKTLKEVTGHFQAEFPPRFVIVLDMGRTRSSKLKPSAAAFLQDAAVYEVFQTPKVNFPHVSYLELIQKTKPTETHEHITYIKVVVKPPADTNEK
jgi:hypothetical protein